MSRIRSAVLATALGAATVLGGATVASADAGAEGYASHSPGVLSGNVIQVPVHVPVNVCGNSISVIGALNPAAGNVCINDGGDHHKGGHDKGGHDKHEKGYGH